MEKKVVLKGMSLAEMKEALLPFSLPNYRISQIADWMYKKGAKDFSDMTNLPQSLREQLAENFSLGELALQGTQQSIDHATTKFALSLADGNLIETVLMRHDYGNSVCISTQVGCPMGCIFCASTLQGMIRNLTAGEMMDQALFAARELKKDGQRLSHLVLMGSGEPLLNYTEVLRFIRLCHESYSLNIGYRHITLSTSGLVPEIERLAEENLPITLSVSLHAPNDSLRFMLMPVNKRYPLDVLIPCCKRYADRTGRRVTFEYTLIRNMNDQPQHALQLANLLHKILCNVNLIPVNPVVERGLLRPEPETVRAFLALLTERGVDATVRREMGTDIQAACGQLRRSLLAVPKSFK